jgi:biofilm PGA synthesis protein PgaA
MGRTFELKNRLTSPPIADHWRLFALGDYANANPPEGFVQRARAGGGLDWRIADLAASAYVAPSWGTYNRTGAGLTADWVATDQLRFSVAADLYSWETPLRALFYGITANDVSARATWRWHESRSVALSASYMPFTDGNQRFSGGLVGKQRLVNLPGFDLTAIAEAYASSNSLGGIPAYYNPTRDLSLTGGLLAEHVLWRRYDIALVQTLQADAGLYSEYGYADNWIGTVKYEHRWRFDPLTEFHYGVLLTRRAYDGSVENAFTVLLGLTQRI